MTTKKGARAAPASRRYRCVFGAAACAVVSAAGQDHSTGIALAVTAPQHQYVLLLSHVALGPVKFSSAVTNFAYLPETGADAITIGAAVCRCDRQLLGAL